MNLKKILAITNIVVLANISVNAMNNIEYPINNTQSNYVEKTDDITKDESSTNKQLVNISQDIQKKE